MQELTDELIQGKILHKLARFGKYKASHTAIENLYNYFPRHMRDRAKENVESLIRKGFLLKKVTCYGVHVSINGFGDNSEGINKLVEAYLKWGKV